MRDFRHATGDKRPLPVPHFEQPLAAQPFVHAQDGVLIHGQLAGQLANRRQPIARLHAAGRTERRNLVGNLPRDGHRRAFFDSQKHAENQGENASDYSSVTVVRERVKKLF